MIGIVNYGSGNIDAFCTIYKKANVPYAVVSTPAELERADRILLPGVGAFDQAIGELQRSGLRQALDEAVFVRRKPVLGICVGMQLLGRCSEEGVEKGLGWINGSVRRFNPAHFSQAKRLPHMGWNTIKPTKANPVFDGLEMPCEFYFLHSYHFVCATSDDELAVTDYGGRFTSAVHRKNVWGMQFHPEKSHQAGVILLHNFAIASLQPSA